MSKKYLGEQIDIHGGGEDLIFPHHENEIAQSESASGKSFANYWMHNAFLNIDNKKMSKSAGNFFTVRDISEKYDLQVLRFFMLSAHYRSPLNFSAELMEAAKNSLERILTGMDNIKTVIARNNTAPITDAELANLEIAKVLKDKFADAMDDDFNTADKLNALLIKALVSTGELNEVETYDVDFDHQFLETEKYDAKPTYKKFLGYRPGVYVIGDMIVYVENSDGNTNVRFYQAETHKRFFALLEANSIRVNRFRADCGSCSKEIVSEIEKHCTHFYIRANRCSSLYDDLFSLRGWKTEEINGIQFELNSILVEKWEGKCYRLVIQRQKRMDGELDLWEGEYTYRCILTNDYDSSTRDIVEFYNKRGGKERIFDDMNNGFGWNRLPKSFMSENTVFLLLTALIHNFYKTIISKLDTKAFGLKETSRIKAFVFSFISVPAKWIMTARQYVLNIYTENRAYARPFKTGFG